MQPHHSPRVRDKQDHLVRQVFSRLLCKIKVEEITGLGQPDLELGREAGSEGCTVGGKKAERTFETADLEALTTGREQTEVAS